MVTPAARDGRHEEVDLFAFVDVLRRRWLLVSVVTALVAGAAIAAAFLMTPVYRSESLLAPVETDTLAGTSALLGELGGLASLAGLATTEGGVREQSIAVLRSRELAEQFIRDKDLLPLLFADLWDAEAGRWTVDDPDDVPTLNDGYELFDEDIRKVSEDSTTGLVELAVEWRDPATAQQWATELVDRVNQRMQSRAIGQSERKLEFLGRELDKTSVVELRQAIYRLIETEISAMMAASVNAEFAFRVLDPASLPDHDEWVSPNRKVLIAGGILAGGFLGLLFALFADFIARYRASRRA